MAKCRAFSELPAVRFPPLKESVFSGIIVGFMANIEVPPELVPQLQALHQRLQGAPDVLMQQVVTQLNTLLTAVPASPVAPVAPGAPANPLPQADEVTQINNNSVPPENAPLIESPALRTAIYTGAPVFTVSYLSSLGTVSNALSAAGLGALGYYWGKHSRLGKMLGPKAGPGLGVVAGVLSPHAIRALHLQSAMQFLGSIPFLSSVVAAPLYATAGYVVGKKAARLLGVDNEIIVERTARWSRFIAGGIGALPAIGTLTQYIPAAIPVIGPIGQYLASYAGWNMLAPITAAINAITPAVPLSAALLSPPLAAALATGGIAALIYTLYRSKLLGINFSTFKQILTGKSKPVNNALYYAGGFIPYEGCRAIKGLYTGVKGLFSSETKQTGGLGKITSAPFRFAKWLVTPRK